MYDELTKVDIQKMEEEIKYRQSVLAPKLGAELKRTREFGDLSENAEYKEAKREKRKNDSRIRYLEAMIRTANVIEIEDSVDRVALFDRVLIFNEKMNAEKTIQIVTTLRQNALLGFVSKESPLGSALMSASVPSQTHARAPPPSPQSCERKRQWQFNCLARSRILWQRQQGFWKQTNTAARAVRSPPL